MKKLEGDTYVIDYDDWDKLIRGNFSGMETYEIVADRELSNDSDMLFEGITKTCKYPWQQRDLDDWLSGSRKYIGEDTMARALVSMGLIPEGNYIIRVSW